jgi:hypothetical protein
MSFRTLPLSSSLALSALAQAHYSINNLEALVTACNLVTVYYNDAVGLAAATSTLFEYSTVCGPGLSTATSAAASANDPCAPAPGQLLGNGGLNALLEQSRTGLTHTTCGARPRSIIGLL